MRQAGSRFSTELARAFVERGTNLHAIASKAGRQDAEDVVQEAFLKVVEASRKEEVRIVENLLSRVVRCAAIDRIRRRASRPEVLNADHLDSADSGTVDPERALIARQCLTSVVATIQSMPDRRREVFLLHRVQELTYPQIAGRLGISLKAVEKHIHLALVQLAADRADT